MHPLWAPVRRVAATVALVSTTLAATSGSTAANPVDDWNSIAAQTIGARGAAGVIDFAYVHIAIYDAVNAIDGRYKVFAVQPSSTSRRASVDAATAAAAHTVLVWLYPAQSDALNATYAAYIANLPANAATAAGVKVGDEVGAAFIALRNGDGRNANVPYTPGAGPGVYQFTAGCTAAVTPWLATMDTFAVKSSTQFRADGPPELGSQRWAEMFNETKVYGSLNGSLRTPAQTEIGQFYAENPSVWFGRNVRGIAVAKRLSTVDAARFYAQVFVTASDALLTAWNSKFSFNFWRPSTAIHQADTDSNAETITDPAWTPLLPTPCHPEYPAAHGAGTGALAYALEQFFGSSNVVISLSSTSVPTVQPLAVHSFSTTQALVEDVIAGRIYGGMHYRTSGEDGARIGRRVARYVASHYFRRVDDGHGPHRGRRSHQRAEHGDDQSNDRNGRNERERDDDRR